MSSRDFSRFFLLLATLAMATACSSKSTDTGTDAGSGGAPSSGGVTGSSGGAVGSGGATTSGGAIGSGGVTASGGAMGSGGTSQSGGTTPTGGTPSSGGRGGVPVGAGGAKATGGGGSAGSPGKGGATATGGAAAGGSSGTDLIATIHNGVFWNDATGKRIEAHGAGFIKLSDTWYWIGEDKSGNSGGFKAVNCYASKDLTQWEFRHAIITKSTSTDLAGAGRIIERPKVIYNDTTKKFVMWLHWDGNSYGDAEAGVFTSDTIDGDYKQESHFRPNKNMARDDYLFKDDDGKAYFMAAANNNADMILYQLSADYLTVEKQVATLWAGSSREAPAMFKANGRYYLITSAATGWDSNQAKYASSTSIAGPWPALQNLGNSNTYDTQSAYVIPVIGTQATTYIFVGDRWQDPDLVGSKYIWFPLKFNGTSLVMDRVDNWTLNLTTGKWSGANDGYLPQSGWKLVKTDSEETEGEDGHATNAFDDSPSTIWHTKYTGGTTPHPHELQIDLGANIAIDGFRYLPRQDADDHGMVAKYEFYVGQDTTSWGTAVASGTFNTDRNEKKVMLATRQTARYIRFVAVSEINDKDWASVAELDLIGTPAP